ncbi:MAG TPA: SRPBCC domain-containing protein [Solirubrobacterales bacterium]
MTGERIEIELGAPPERVYEAIATADGVRSWWTDWTFAEEVGEVGRLRFRHGWTKIQVERLDPVDEGARTNLDFTHAGLGCEEMCSKGWSHYIGVSLKGLVERGEPAPGPGAGSGG